MPDNEKDFVKIDNESFEFIEEIGNIPIVDSFVKKNKIGKGSGEGRLYIGAQRARNFDDFFESFQGKSFFLKRDFESYLKDA